METSIKLGMFSLKYFRFSKFKSWPALIPNSKLLAKWAQSENEEIINLEGTADLEWNTDEQIKKSIKFSGLVELKQKENTYNIYSYTPIVPINKTPCETQIKDGTWISSEGVDVNYF